MVTKRDPKVVMAPSYQGERRRMRRPQHKFAVYYHPYAFQPIMIAPVLPGETLQNLLLQSRVVSDPLALGVKLLGWWNEYWFFYVKHRDLQEPLRSAMAAMALDPSQNLNAHRSVAAAPYYHFDNGVNFTLECQKVVLEEYFRDEGEAWNTGGTTPTGMPLVRIYGRGQNDAFDKLTKDSAYRELGVAIPTGAEASVEDLDYAYMQYQAMKDAGLMAMDYEDFIRSYGVQVREDEASPNLHRPELIRHIREWSYPTNIVEPTSGVPTTAVTFSVAARADKRCFISEPGWIVGYTTCRPKVYLKSQTGSVAHGMTNVQNWLPPAIHTRSDVSHKQFAYSEGPLPDLFDDTPGSVVGANPSGYWIDLRDLLAYGDQYYSVSGGPAGSFTLPDNTGQRRYATSAEVTALFKTAGTERLLCDGVVSLGVLGRQSPRTATQVVLGSGSLVP